ncbi:MAG: NRDE family protein [Halovenus sp.]
MCTLVIAWQVFPDAPVVVAANRDEQDGRPSEPPAVRDWEVPTVAPVDLDAGGTWLGFNEHDVLVTVTNRWVDTDLEGERSRGLLVRDALAEDSAEAAARFVERELRTRSYRGCNLLFADASAAILLEWDGTIRAQTLQPGVHVVVNVGADGEYTVPESRRDAGTDQATNANAVHAALKPEPGEKSDAWLSRAQSVLGDHGYGVCVHGDGFGTRSSSLVRLGEHPVYRYADGPPCETEFEPYPARPE